MGAAPQLAEDLFNEHYRRLYVYCLRQLGSPEEAEDAVQATYLNACRSLNTGFQPDAAQAWLFKVAQNVCLTRQRSSYRRARLERPQDLQEVQDFVAAPERPGDELFGLDDALATLPEQQRQAILLREWQGLSYREVATKLGLTQAAVETLIFRARRSLATALEKPAQHRRRLVHAFDGGALLASLKSAITANMTASVATAVAVAASVTTIAATPASRFLDFPTHAPPVPKASAPQTASPHERLSDRTPLPAAASFAPSASPKADPKGRAGSNPKSGGKHKARGKGADRAGHGHPSPPAHARGTAQAGTQGGGNAESHAPAAPPKSQSSAPAHGQGGKKG
jgi:RNA polymerase sigma-70 factor, ECF subfamily